MAIKTAEQHKFYLHKM